MPREFETRMSIFSGYFLGELLFGVGKSIWSTFYTLKRRSSCKASPRGLEVELGDEPQFFFLSWGLALVASPTRMYGHDFRDQGEYGKFETMGGVFTGVCEPCWVR